MGQIKPNSNQLNQLFKKWFWVLSLIDIAAIQFSQSTFDSGDSVLHYLHARQAVSYPYYFLEHWSKPLFVLLAALPANAGFWGMKLFNSACILVGTWYAFRFLEKKTNLAWMVIPFLLFAPEFFLSQASGLTEPLFSAMLMISIFMWDKRNRTVALIIASFLPFVRSEGWFVLPIFAVIALISGSWKSILWLLTGHIVYSLAGGLAQGDFLWMFHENPYQGVEIKYGRGHWSHYIIQTPYLLGIPLTLMLVAGLIRQGFRCIPDLRNAERRDHVLLIYGITVAFYAAHSIFWHFGLFHSFGLKRVFIAIIPLIGIIGVEGVAFGLEKLSQYYQTIFAGVIGCITILFPFTPNKTGFILPESFQLQPSQHLVRQCAMWYRSSPFKTFRVSYSNHYFGMELDKDMDNPKQVMPLGKLISGELPPETLIFWDNYFSVTDQGVTSEMLNRPDIRLLRTFKDEAGNEIRAYWLE